ncbi:hypothetical protein Taro_023973 [Colocasia esculenta]|uniref:Uncharacterized protein n=1 Tax=Colocasia esculenta TaxID=4460 RepID=A0A843VG30_COLES|nr:hypothetical protein [Colocasia esculenta]
MAASGSSDSVRGYNATSLTVDQLERYSTVKIKLCGNKALDLEDLQKKMGLSLLQSKILVPRSATFSSSTKGDADMMFWAIQKQDINMAQVYTNLSQVVSTQSTCVFTRLRQCVDTASECVDTRPSSQKTSFPQMGQCVDTLPGGVDIVHLKLKNVNFSGHVAVWELGDLT